MTCFRMFSTDSKCFPFSSFFRQGNKKKVTRSQVGTVRRLGDHRCVAPDQEIGNDEGRVAGSIVMVELDRVSDVSPHERDSVFQSLEHLQVKG